MNVVSRLLFLLAFWVGKVFSNTFGTSIHFHGRVFLPNSYYDQASLSDPPPIEVYAPNIVIEDMAMALRWTAEMNRRLQNGIQKLRSVHRIIEPNEASSVSREPSRDPLRGGQTTPYRIQAAAASSEAGDALDTESLTIFHAETPLLENNGISSSRRGAARWGPDLVTYLHNLVSLLGEEEPGAEKDSISTRLELMLAMMYMDRACSVDTLRSDGSLPCPFCTPRTVHRLTLAALLVAIQTVRGTDAVNDMYPKVSEVLDIPLIQLHQMVDWMHHALGDHGVFVEPYEIGEFARVWEARFSGAN